jgi:IS1 family transposase
MNKRTRQVIALIVGRRTKDNVGRVIMRLKELKPKKIYTDKLNIYPTLIDKDIHVIGAHKINHIERFNLTLRTHLKRLSRKTICFSKSAEMLENCLKLYICDIQAL